MSARQRVLFSCDKGNRMRTRLQGGGVPAKCRKKMTCASLGTATSPLAALRGQPFISPPLNYAALIIFIAHVVPSILCYNRVLCFNSASSSDINRNQLGTLVLWGLACSCCGLRLLHCFIASCCFLFWISKTAFQPIQKALPLLSFGHPLKTFVFHSIWNCLSMPLILIFKNHIIAAFDR